MAPATSDLTVRASWRGPLAVTGLVAGAGCVLAVVDPARGGLFPPCPFWAVTGHWCPGCGTLRGLHELLTGHPAAAFGFNPLLMLVLPFLVGALVAWWARSLGILERPPRVLPTPLPWLTLTAVVFWGLRNVPVEPLTALAP